MATLLRTAAAVLIALFVPALAAAKTERVHGVVLAVTASTGQAIVRHDAFGGMPSMSMPFRIEPRSRIGELQPGNASTAPSTRPPSRGRCATSRSPPRSP